MSNARRRRRYLRWYRYVDRTYQHTHPVWLGGPVPPSGLIRAARSQYRNGAVLPYGWQPRPPKEIR